MRRPFEDVMGVQSAMNDLAAGSGYLLSELKRQIRDLQNRHARCRAKWLERARYFHREDLRYLKFLIPAGSRVLELGCGNGHLLANLKPAYGVGVDFSEEMIAHARAAYPSL